MKQMKINHQSQAIELSKSFASKASKYGSDEYRILTAAQKDFPSYKTIITASAKRKTKDSYKGLSYEYMEQYIKKQENHEEKLTAFYTLIAKNIDKETANPAHYTTVKKWFLKEFPEIKDFQNKRDELIREAKESNVIPLKKVANM